MKITDFLSVKGIKIDLEATDKEGILKEMVDLLAEVKDVGDKKISCVLSLNGKTLALRGSDRGSRFLTGRPIKWMDSSLCSA